MGEKFMIKFTKQDVSTFLQQNGLHLDKLGEKSFDKILNKQVYKATLSRIDAGVKEQCWLDIDATTYIVFNEKDEMFSNLSTNWIKFLIVQHPENIPQYQAIFDQKIKDEQADLNSKISKFQTTIDMLKVTFKIKQKYWENLKGFADNVDKQSQNLTK